MHGPRGARFRAARRDDLELGIGIEALGQNTHLHYALVRYGESGPPRVSLMRWYGKRPNQEEVYF